MYTCDNVGHSAEHDTATDYDTRRSDNLWRGGDGHNSRCTNNKERYRVIKDTSRRW
jgi:hypothetical protein